MGRKIKVAASILAADFSKLLEEVKSAEKAGADLIHVDVMDGHFVPNISIGVPVVNSLKGKTPLPLDVHLMIEDPAKYIEPFAEAGSDSLTFHVEIRGSVGEIIENISRLGVSPGISLNPETSSMRLEPFLDKIDSVLVMTVSPGFGGQELKQEAVDKISALRDKIDRKRLDVEIAVDGGVNPENAGRLISAGADILVAGTSVFGSDDMKEAIRQLKEAANV